MRKLKSKIVMMCIVMMLAGIVEVYSSPVQNSVQAATMSKNKKALNAYKKLLNKKLKKSGQSNNVSFEVVDANNDGISELYITNYDENRYELYTYYNGKTKEIGCGGNTGYSNYTFYEKGNIFIFGEMHRGYEEQIVYGIVKGKSKELASYSYYGGMLGEDDDAPEYKINNKKTSKSKYEQYIKKHTKNSKEIGYDNQHGLTSDNIKKYVK